MSRPAGPVSLAEGCLRCQACGQSADCDQGRELLHHRQGSFFLEAWLAILQAVVKDVALSVPHFLDFGLCPTMERAPLAAWDSDGPRLPTEYRHLQHGHLEGIPQVACQAGCPSISKPPEPARPPFAVRCPTQSIDVGQSVRCVVEFEPKTASVFDGLIACEAPFPPAQLFSLSGGQRTSRGRRSARGQEICAAVHGREQNASPLRPRWPHAAGGVWRGVAWQACAADLRAAEHHTGAGCLPGTRCPGQLRGR